MADFAPPSGPPPPKVPEGWKALWNEQYKEWYSHPPASTSSTSRKHIINIFSGTTSTLIPNSPNGIVLRLPSTLHHPRLLGALHPLIPAQGPPILKNPALALTTHMGVQQVSPRLNPMPPMPLVCKLKRMPVHKAVLPAVALAMSTTLAEEDSTSLLAPLSRMINNNYRQESRRPKALAAC